MIEPSTRGGNWLERHQEFVERARRGDVNVLFLGDSITDGWRNVGIDTWRTRFEPLGAANFGLWGDGTPHLLWRLLHGELENIRPRVTVILIGTNDIPWEVTREQADAARAFALEAISEVVATVRSKLPSTRMLLLGVFPREEKPCLSREVIRELNAQLAQLADGRSVRFLDLGDIFLQGGDIPATIMPDGLHLSAEGYRAWGDALLPVLERMLRESDAPGPA